ncbi:hypothetical protein PTTG_28862 [Puccinia triticina 1-1 BBBD Race 1]|uniref:Uncharacterized protein n=1 Tax=Puccinia triticina (isolate 1-1 / race 1 (BBBD)) TaxID=630390 RepID=A0A180G9D2_PUCT1|nr:hypothetical protein PTTG_28862 [Puccinia triticina 1-1 BBBD Race 1]
MPPRKKKNSTNPSASQTKKTTVTPAPAPTPAPRSAPTTKKRPPISWEKDTVDGFSSIRILLDWLREDGNYVRWQGNKKKGLNKEALASEVVAIMKERGIDHRNNKDIQTKIQELQENYCKASNWLNNTGSGVLDEDIANGTNNVRAAVLKISKYHYELDEVMGDRTCTKPEALVDSTKGLVPDLLGSDQDEEETSPIKVPLATNQTIDVDEPLSPGPDSSLKRKASYKNRKDKEETSPIKVPLATNQTIDVDEPSSPGPDSSLKRKASYKNRKASLPQGLEKAISESNDFCAKSLRFKERRETNQLALESSQEKKRIKIDKRRLRIEESDAQVRRAHAEAELVRVRIACMTDLKKAGFSNDHIEKFIEKQFGQGSSKNPISDDSATSESSNDSD